MNKPITVLPLVMLAVLAFAIGCEDQASSPDDSSGSTTGRTVRVAPPESDATESTSEELAADSANRPEEPAAPQAAPSAEDVMPQPRSKPNYELQGGVYAPLDYVSLVTRSRDIGKKTASMMNLRSVGQTLELWKQVEGSYPDSLDVLVDGGNLPESALQSPGGRDAWIVYLKPTKPLRAGDVLAFDPVGYPGNQFVVLQKSATAVQVSYEELKRRLEAQQGRFELPRMPEDR